MTRSKDFSLREKVFELCKEIPSGKVATYKAIAGKLNIHSCRLIGQILKNNPTPISIPCHRVINSSGNVGGYFGAKNSTEKIMLLRKEGVEIVNNKVDLNKFLFRI